MLIPPTIYSVQNDGLCDLSKSACSSITVTGATFVYSQNLVCRLLAVKVLNGKVERSDNVTFVQASYFSFNEITCPLANVGSYEVQISNNNSSFRQPFIFTVFNPDCLNCNATGICTLAPEKCFINNQCFFYGQENPQNQSLVCDNYDAPDKWSIKRDYPYIRGKPVLSTSYNETLDEFIFLCEFTEHEHPKVTYFIEWLHLSQRVTKYNVTDMGVNSTVLKLNVSEIPNFFHMSNVSCVLTACYTDNCTSSESPPKTSNAFHVNIAIVEQNVVVTEGMGPAYIKVAANVPTHLLCEGSSVELCSVYVSLQYVKATNEYTCPQSDTVIQQLIFPHIDNELESCSTRFNKWPTVRAPVSATIDSLVEGHISRSVEVFIKFEYNSTVEVIRSIGQQQVNIIDRDISTMCGSVNDPHMSSFDGQTYNIYLEGEFILYKHTTLPCEVHGYYRKCNTKAACNCAVSVKYGDDVILIDRCGSTASDKPIPVEVKIFKNGMLTPGLRIIQQLEGRKFKITLPTGTEIKVTVTNHFLNVWVQASALDFNNTEGLCGNYNKDPSDDWKMPSGTIFTGISTEPNEFTLSWRVNSTLTHYRGICATDSTTSESLFCRCTANDSSECQTGLNVVKCPLSNTALKLNGGGIDVTEFYVNNSLTPQCNGEQFEYDANYTSHALNWSVFSNWTEVKARNFCINYIRQSTIGVMCGDIFTLSYNTTVSSCVSDIQIMDSTDYAVEALSNLLEQCLSGMTRTVEYWVSNKPNTTFLDLMCINNCNDRGNCSKGVCQCSDGFGGVDCSINLKIPPTILSVLPKLSCEVKSENCQVLTVIGGPFVDSGDLTCVFEQINYFGEKNYTVRANSTYIVSAVFKSYERITCQLPFTASFQLSVQNVLNITSNVVIYQAYNLDCFTCTGANCYKQPIYCFIENECYLFTTIKSDNSDLFCDPSTNKSDWTKLNDFIKIEIKPNLTTSFKINLNQFNFVCDWTGFVNFDTYYTIYAQWYHDDDLVNEMQIIGNKTAYEMSYLNFIGLKHQSKVVGNLSLVVKEGYEDKVFRISSNFPPLVFCDKNNNSSCEISITMQVPPSSSSPDIRCPVTKQPLPQLVFRWQTEQPSIPACAVVINNNNWQLTQTVVVRAVLDGKIDGDVLRDVTVLAQLTQNISIVVGSLQVKIIDTDNAAICQSLNYPQMTTFDGMYYNNFNPGEYVLYRHASGKQEVRAYYRKCRDGKASCNCALIVRAGKTVVRIDRCGPLIGDPERQYPLNVDMVVDGGLTQGLTVASFDDGRKYEIRLPTGMKVIVTIDSKRMHFAIQATSNDFKQTSGLCGNYDGNITNDLTSRSGEIISPANIDTFSLSWRVNKEESIYGGYCGNAEGVVATQPVFCACDTKQTCNGEIYQSGCQDELRYISGGSFLKSTF
ncbi:uncharacterized protein LOC131943151 [Physella acuta]|uniref:uncharacterized protein LOC131943151 n=1 Tax=Physella acuta TaxID=109671 RepID=UPI0027DE1352|nr:uncharacterized protein LOC131943151 [Physella acuta]